MNEEEEMLNIIYNGVILRMNIGISRNRNSEEM